MPKIEQIFIKQYGAKRTGTNTVRVLLQDNFPNVTVLMHILGDKHGQLSQLAGGAVNKQAQYSHSLFEEQTKICKSAAEWVWEATLETPALTTDAYDQAQKQYLETLAPDLLKALSENKVYYLLSVKNPYAWAVSILRMQGKLPQRTFGGKCKPLNRYDQLTLLKNCQEYNSLYSHWLGNAALNKTRWLIIHNETLMTEPETFLQEFNELTDFAAIAPSVEGQNFRSLQGVVTPTHWDNNTSQAHFVEFDTSYYTQQRYLQDLNNQDIAFITEQINWEVFTPLGYLPLGH